MASPDQNRPEISSIHVDSQGFLIGERRLAELAKGIDQVAENTAQMLEILKQDQDKRNSASQNTTPQSDQPRPAPTEQSRILPNLPPTIHSSDGRQGRIQPASNQDPANPPDSQVDRNQSARRTSVYSGDTVNSTEIRDRVRDTNGRFTSSGNSQDESGTGEHSTAAKITDAIKDGMMESAKIAAPQGTDPILDALHEASSVIKPVAGLFGGKDEKIPKDQTKHNKTEIKLLKRIAASFERGSGSGSSGGGLFGGGLMRLLPMMLSALGGIVGAVISGLTAAAPIIAAALAAALVAWLASKALDKANKAADDSRPAEQGDINPDGSSNKGVVGLANRKAKAVMNGIRGGLNTVNEKLGGDADYWDDGTAPDSKNRVGLKTDPVNGGKGVSPLITGKENKVNGTDKAPSLSKLIGRHEGGDKAYGAFNRGVAGDSTGKSIDFSQLSISEILGRSKLPYANKDRIFAAGKYQVIPSTLKEATQKLGISHDEKFTPELQERIFSEYLIGAKRPKIQAYREGKNVSRDAALYEMSMEFASFPVPAGYKTKNGRISDGKMGYHDNDKGGNKASVKMNEAIAAIDADRDAYNKAMSHKSSKADIPPSFASSGNSNSSDIVNKTATNMTTTMNDVISGKTKLDTDTSKASKINQKTSTPKTPEALAKFAQNAEMPSAMNHPLITKTTDDIATTTRDVLTEKTKLDVGIPQTTESNPAITKSANDIAATMNDVLAGRVKPVTATASTPPLANKLTSTTKNPFMPAQGIAGITAPVLPPAIKPFKVPEVPPMREKLGSDDPIKVQFAGSSDNIGQNVGDRGLAHAITGGLGERK